MVTFYEDLGFRTHKQRKPTLMLNHRAELAMVPHDPEAAAELPANVQSVVLTEEETCRASSAFDDAAALAAALR